MLHWNIERMFKSFKKLTFVKFVNAFGYYEPWIILFELITDQDNQGQT